ncbi:MAG TPA: protein kinase [Blastocatellia bacterium]|nr:protein kinase [Blastocatellia bacterium]
MISQTISHYRIIRGLGAGGMGEVYLAEDTRLDRQVAIKILPASYQYDPVRRTRFLQEARATSALRSPNIVAIYDIGEHEGAIYIVMEYVEGETLSLKLKRGPLPVNEAIEVAMQIAEALTEAHSLGITHCDIKSANLIVSERGIVKILDFGIAESARYGAEQSGDHTQKLGHETNISLVAGTVSYMSPEQALGREVDNRSDIFSLGVVLYEMLTGRLPFEGETAIETADKIIHEEPAPIARLNYSVPPELERITRRCMEKDRERRYQSTRELLTDLRNLKRDSDSAARATIDLARQTRVVRRQRASRVIDSLAILPVINLSGDPDTEYLSDGITESIINNLSRLPRLRVMARSTVFRYKTRATQSLIQPSEPLDPIDAGRELGVRAVLIGRLLQRDDTLIIRAELVDTNDGAHLWGGQFTRKMSDIFALEEDISKEISEALKLKLTGAQKKRLARRYTENTEAYQLYLKGRYHWNKRTEEGIKKSTQFFEQAIRLDPNYTLAYAGLADAYNLLASYSAMPPRTAFLRAKATAMKALKLDDKLAEAHTALAHIRFWYEWDWAGAERGLKKSIEFNRGYATAHLWYSLLLAATERLEEAITESRRAQELDPLSVVTNLNVARILYFARRYDEAIEACRKTLEMYPTFFIAHRRLGQIYTEKRMYEEAEAALQKSKELAENNSETISTAGYNYAVWGRAHEARREFDELTELSQRDYVSPYSIARIHLGLGEFDLAFEHLEKAFQERHGILVYLKVDPIFDSVRHDERFISLLERIGLIESAAANE